MSAPNRPERVAQVIQQHLAQVFARGNMKDPRLGLVTITGAKISPDLRQARVYWTVHGDAKVQAETKKGLEAARGFLRRELGQLGLRVVPDLAFSYDEAIDRGDRIDQLLREAKEADTRRMSDAPLQDGAGSGEGPK
jgi:ribosome-binding factor A